MGRFNSRNSTTSMLFNPGRTLSSKSASFKQRCKHAFETSKSFAIYANDAHRVPHVSDRLASQRMAIVFARLMRRWVASGITVYASDRD